MATFEHDDPELERALKALHPARSQLSIEQLAFDAGMRVGRRSTNLYRALTAVSLVAAAGSFALRLTPPATSTQRVVVVHALPPPADVSVASSAPYLRLRDAVIENGWTALPGPTGGGMPLTMMSVRSME